jgi:phosphodiesterase/alkaline phosphatase D-like protein
MSNRPDERLDRRDFMIASVTTAGASAALAMTAGVANAQSAAPPSANPVSGTVYTGDTIQSSALWTSTT